MRRQTETLEAYLDRRIAEQEAARQKLDWITALPVLWQSSGEVDRDPWPTLVALGALWAGELAGIETAWANDTLYGGAGLVRAIIGWRYARAGKDGLWLSAGPSGIMINLSRNNTGLWAGRIDAHQIWSSCRAAFSRRDPVDAACYDDIRVWHGRIVEWSHPTINPSRIDAEGSLDQGTWGTSCTGYDQDAVSIASRDGFAVSKHIKLHMVRRPARELLMLLGAEWCARQDAAQNYRRDDQFYLALPAAGGRAWRDAGEAAADVQADRHRVPYPSHSAGKRRYLGRGGGRIARDELRRAELLRRFRVRATPSQRAAISQPQWRFRARTLLSMGLDPLALIAEQPAVTLCPIARRVVIEP